MNTINEVIDVTEITKGCRYFDPKELLSLLRQRINIFWSWGANKFIVDSQKNCKMFRMTVQGHHHKGYVYIFLNGIDLFDVYLTSNRGTIKKIIKDLYFDMLVDAIDVAVEKISDYVQ